MKYMCDGHNSVKPVYTIVNTNLHTESDRESETTNRKTMEMSDRLETGRERSKNEGPRGR